MFALASAVAFARSIASRDTNRAKRRTKRTLITRNALIQRARQRNNPIKVRSLARRRMEPARRANNIILARFSPS